MEQNEMTIGLFFCCVMDLLLFYAIKWAGKSMVMEKVRCKQIGCGRYVGEKVVRISCYGSYRRRAEFEVEVDGKLQRLCAIDDLSRRKWKEFEEGKMYTLYINPEKPETFRCTTKVIYPDELLIWIVGSLFFYGCAIVFILELFKSIYHFIR